MAPLVRSGMPLGLNTEAGGEPSAARPQAQDPRPSEFYPHAPKSLDEADLTEIQVESLLLKVLLHRGVVSGRKLSDHICLPFPLISEILRRMKTECLVAYKSSSSISDYEYELTGSGVERAHRFNEVSSYFGSAPVSLEAYEKACDRQSILAQRPGPDQVRQALSDLIIEPITLNQLGQAVRAARAMFLYGAPGNGKTSIAERISRSFGKSIWIPRTINFDGEIVRMLNPIMHVEDPLPDVVTALKPLDQRWVRIRRPTVVAGGEMTLANLELTPVQVGGVLEAPLQLKSNGGVLVIDDFGRQRVGTTELLNRWIVPLERRHDFLDSPCGRKVKVPFDQLVIFATNLQPESLIDEAFLRRIPYKIEMHDPSTDDFRAMLRSTAPRFNLKLSEQMIEYLVQTHYIGCGRAMRACHPRDLMQQVSTMCEYNSFSSEVTREYLDIAVSNYFGSLLIKNEQRPMK